MCVPEQKGVRTLFKTDGAMLMRNWELQMGGAHQFTINERVSGCQSSLGCPLTIQGPVRCLDSFWCEYKTQTVNIAEASVDARAFRKVPLLSYQPPTVVLHFDACNNLVLNFSYPCDQPADYVYGLSLWLAKLSPCCCSCLPADQPAGTAGYCFSADLLADLPAGLTPDLPAGSVCQVTCPPPFEAAPFASTTQWM
eukprot:1154868-Pelagomonas_calceolata.AAC.7